MKREQLKKLLSNLKEIVAELESEVYSDPSKYLQHSDQRVVIGDDNDGETD